MGKQNSYLVGVIVCVVIAVIAFFAGAVYQRVHVVSPFITRQNMMFGQFPRRFIGRFGSGFNGMGRNSIYGQVTNVSGNQITIKLTNGVTRTVSLSSSTTYTKTDQATQADIKQGENVSIFGQTTSNGSASAQNVQISQ